MQEANANAAQEALVGVVRTDRFKKTARNRNNGANGLTKCLWAETRFLRVSASSVPLAKAFKRNIATNIPLLPASDTPSYFTNFTPRLSNTGTGFLFWYTSCFRERFMDLDTLADCFGQSYIL